MPFHSINVEDLRNEHAIIKQQMAGAIVLLRIGDCFETFDNDAETVAHDLKRQYIWQETDDGADSFRALTIPASSDRTDDCIWRLLTRGHRVVTATIREVQS